MNYFIDPPLVEVVFLGGIKDRTRLVMKELPYTISYPVPTELPGYSKSLRVEYVELEVAVYFRVRRVLRRAGRRPEPLFYYLSSDINTWEWEDKIDEYETRPFPFEI